MFASCSRWQTNAIQHALSLIDRMNEHALHIHRSIDSVSKALAEWTVSAQFEADATLSHRYGEGSRRRWVADTQARISHLSQALAVRSPELFVDSVYWMREAFVARGSDAADLELNLKCLRDVMAAELPVVVTEAAVPCVERALSALRTPHQHAHANDDATDSHGGIDPHASLATLATGYVNALVAGDGEAAQRVVLDAAETGLPVRDLYRHVLCTAMNDIGRRWQMDEIGVAEEHFATAITQMVMSRLRPHFQRLPRRERRVIATAAQGDLHEIGVRMVADHFEMAGWDAMYLGANMPLQDVLTTIIERDVHIAAISASSVVHLAALGETIDAIRAAPGCERVRVLVGGPPFNRVPNLWKEIGADGWARDAVEAVEVGNRLVDANDAPASGPASASARPA